MVSRDLIIGIIVIAVLVVGGIVLFGGKEEVKVFEPEKPAIAPSVSVSGQQVQDSNVVIEKVVAAEPGWMVIHADVDGKPGTVIGQTAVEVGENSNVVVEIDLEKATPTLFAMLHYDAGEVGVYEFPGDDVPVKIDENIVVTGFSAEKEEVQAEPIEAPAPLPTVKEFSISSDDRRFDPNSIQVNKGDNVKITFNFDSGRIYFGGLDVRSDYFDVQYRKGEDPSKIAEFTAEESFTFISYWPASNKLKARGNVVVV